MSKVILVTGVSKGIGKSIVEVLLTSDENAIVYGVARSEAPLKELKQKYSDRFFFVVGDITHDEVVRRLVNDAVQGHCKIDSLIANAGILEPIEDVNSIDVKAWKRLYDVNFFSIVSLVSYALPHLSETNGNLIFVSSGSSVKPYYGQGAYGSSKAALNHFAMTIAEESSKVKTISVAPGVVDTQMQVDIREKYGPRSMTAESLKRFTDLKKDNLLLDAAVPAAVFSKLALKGIPQNLNGKYLRYNDERLA